MVQIDIFFIDLVFKSEIRILSGELGVAVVEADLKPSKRTQCPHR